MKKHTIIAAAALAALLTVQPTFAADENNAPKDSPAAQKRAVDQPAEAARQATGDKSALPAAQPPPEGAAQPAAAREDAVPAAAAGRADTAAISKDQDFLMNAASGNLFEVQSGQLAQQRSQDDSVKQLAQRLIQDHQQAQQKLQQAAQAKNMDVPQQLSPVHQAKLQKLQKYQGRDFDKHYLAMQTGGHVSNILMYRDAAQMLQDQGLKQYASQTLQHLEAHYQAIAQAAGWSGEARTAGSHQHGTGTTGSGASGTGTTGSGSGTTGSGTGTGTGTGGTGTGTGGGTTGGTGTSGSGAGTGAGTPGSNRNTTDNPPGTSR